ncbi:hypothetical protein [Pseudanabaena minima]
MLNLIALFHSYGHPILVSTPKAVGVLVSWQIFWTMTGDCKRSGGCQ